MTSSQAISPRNERLKATQHTHSTHTAQRELCERCRRFVDVVVANAVVVIQSSSGYYKVSSSSQSPPELDRITPIELTRDHDGIQLCRYADDNFKTELEEIWSHFGLQPLLVTKPHSSRLTRRIAVQPNHRRAVFSNSKQTHHIALTKAPTRSAKL